MEINEIKSLTNLGSVAGAFLLGTLIAEPANVTQALLMLSVKWDIWYFIALIFIPSGFGVYRLHMKLSAARDMADDTIRTKIMTEQALNGMSNTRNKMANSKVAHKLFLGKYLNKITDLYMSGNGTEVHENDIEILWGEAKNESKN